MRIQPWTSSDILKADELMGDAGVPFHFRSDRVADFMYDQQTLANNTSLRARVAEEYEKLFPDHLNSWSGMGTGFVNSLDRVRKIKLPFIWGTAVLRPHQICGFENDSELWQFCRERKDIYEHVSQQAYFVMHANNVEPSKISNELARFLWQKSNAYLNSIADNLSTSYFVGFSNSETWLVFELAAKALLVSNGATKDDLIRVSHRKEPLLSKLQAVLPSKELSEIEDIVSILPDYISSRYEPYRASRIDVVTQASAAQIGAAICSLRLPDRLDSLSKL